MGAQNWLAVCLILIVLAISAAVHVTNYKECRAHGFSTLYCMTRK